MQPPIFGFNRVDALRLLHPDRLHVHGAGIVKYMVDTIARQLQPAQIRAVNTQLGLVRIRRVPSSGFEARDLRITSKERFQLLKALVPALSPLMPEAAGAITGGSGHFVNFPSLQMPC